MVLFRIIVLLMIVVMTSGCYHMRVNPEPLPTHQIVTKKNAAVVERIIRRILESELNIRILDEGDQGKMLISAPRHFATDNSFGMPAGGRQYYAQLQMEVNQEKDGCLIILSPYHYELRTSYAYGFEGQVHTLYKVYPYPEYPGMFDLSYLEQYMKKVSVMLENALKEIQ